MTYIKINVKNLIASDILLMPSDVLVNASDILLIASDVLLAPTGAHWRSSRLLCYEKQATNSLPDSIENV
jgi:hypothetical protein